MNNLILLNQPNISVTWRAVFDALCQPGVDELSPVVVSTRAVSIDRIEEDTSIRKPLDAALTAHNRSSVDTVSNTLFPSSLWNRSKPRSLLYNRYMASAWPRIRKCPANYRGTYFQRFIAYDSNATQPTNQLEHVIDTWRNRSNHRHSALQLAVFDPERDHLHTRRLGFPCLHQVAFTPEGANGSGGLSVTGFYATQHIFEKAYGNYVGLCRLGQFMAHELGLTFVGMTCVTVLAKLGISKNDVSDLQRSLPKST